MSVIEAAASTEAEERVTPRVQRMAGKRLFDIALGIPLCLLAIPMIAVLAVVLAVHHQAFPLFVHDRIGRGGRLLSVPKLRTLSPSHHPYADKTVSALEPSSALTAFLRRTHLDELPQLFLVPIGRLSLVGPRPRMVIEAEEFGDADYDQMRVSVPQGCTGLWQIGEGKAGRVSDHPEYDWFYVEHRSARLDGWILWRTALQTFGAKPVNFADVPRWALRRGAALSLAEAV